ncbi:hypothetical protein M1563_02845 [Patescibacteria group bacterium]|nr:hypothetical protein [Patescibacteria group bacterium]MCL5409907.1 hypothetical protein [Patescibacteria group bacterium]
MVIWFLLFFLVVGISLILAVRSMSDFRETPFNLPTKYSVYLIRKPAELTTEVLAQIYQTIIPRGLIVSLEKLYKGDREALAIFAPEEVVNLFGTKLDLLELEDYAQTSAVKDPDSQLNAWEVGKRSLTYQAGSKQIKPPKLDENEQYWWQIVLQPVQQSPVGKLVGSLRREPTQADSEPMFCASLRGLSLVGTASRVGELKDQLINNYRLSGLSMLPQRFTSEQIATYYRERAIGTAFFTQVIGQPLSQSKENGIVFLSNTEICNLVN